MFLLDSFQAVGCDPHKLLTFFYVKGLVRTENHSAVICPKVNRIRARTMNRIRASMRIQDRKPERFRAPALITRSRITEIYHALFLARLSSKPDLV